MADRLLPVVRPDFPCLLDLLEQAETVLTRSVVDKEHLGRAFGLLNYATAYGPDDPFKPVKDKILSLADELDGSLHCFDAEGLENLGLNSLLNSARRQLTQVVSELEDWHFIDIVRDFFPKLSQNLDDMEEEVKSYSRLTKEISEMLDMQLQVFRLNRELALADEGRSDYDLDYLRERLGEFPDLAIIETNLQGLIIEQAMVSNTIVTKTGLLDLSSETYFLVENCLKFFPDNPFAKYLLDYLTLHDSLDPTGLTLVEGGWYGHLLRFAYLTSSKLTPRELGNVAEYALAKVSELPLINFIDLAQNGSAAQTDRDFSEIDIDGMAIWVHAVSQTNRFAVEVSVRGMRSTVYLQPSEFAKLVSSFVGSGELPRRYLLGSCGLPDQAIELARHIETDIIFTNGVIGRERFRGLPLEVPNIPDLEPSSLVLYPQIGWHEAALFDLASRMRTILECVTGVSGLSDSFHSWLKTGQAPESKFTALLESSMGYMPAYLLGRFREGLHQLAEIDLGSEAYTVVTEELFQHLFGPYANDIHRQILLGQDELSPDGNPVEPWRVVTPLGDISRIQLRTSRDSPMSAFESSYPVVPGSKKRIIAERKLPQTESPAGRSTPFIRFSPAKLK